MALEEQDERPQKKVLVLGHLKEQVHGGSVEKFVGFSTDLARKQDYSPERVTEMENVFKEVFSNIVSYAFRTNGGDIEVSCSLDRTERMIYKIIDWGEPFNMLLSSDPLFRDEWAEQGMAQPSARLTKRLTDTVEYQRLEQMNYLFLTFSSVAKNRP